MSKFEMIEQPSHMCGECTAWLAFGECEELKTLDLLKDECRRRGCSAVDKRFSTGRSLYADDFIIRYVSGMRSEVDLARGVMYPNKLDHKDIRAYDPDFYDPTATKISYFYVVGKRGDAKTVGKMPAEVSLITKEFIDNPRSQNYNMGYQVRRWSKREDLRVTTELPPLKEIFDFIKNWDNTSGKKYGARLASSYDKNFFANHYAEVKDQCQALFFYLGDKLVGYSILEIPDPEERDEVDGYLVSRYGPRKVDITAGSNLCQFVDYTAMKMLRERVGADFILHWGSAEKGIRLYEHRNFPFYREDIYLQYVLHPVEVKTKKLF